MDTLWQFVTQYGYWAVVLGGLVEGDTLLILAGFAARLGHLDLLAVMAVGAFMEARSDVLLFSLGRWRGKQVAIVLCGGNVSLETLAAIQSR